MERDNGIISSSVRGAFVVVLILAGVARSQATSPATAPTASPATQPAGAEEAKPLIAGLESDDAHLRQHSQAALVRMGEAARPLLADLLKHPRDLEVATRAEAALRQIDADRVYGPSYITLHLKDADAGAAIAQLARQCFAPLPTNPENLLDQPGLPKVNIDVTREPFWVVMQQITQQTGLDLQPVGEGTALVRGAMRASGPSVLQGPFLIVANQISRSKVVQLLAGGGGNPIMSDFSLNMMAYGEPKLRVVRCNSAVKLDEAIDDQGNSLVPNGPNNQGFYGGGGNDGYWPLAAHLAWPAHNPGARIVRLRGSTSFTIQTKSQTIEIDDLPAMKDRAQVVDGNAVTFNSFARNGAIWELKFHVAVSPQNPIPFFAVNNLVAKLRILDAQGRALDHGGSSSRSTNTDTEMSLQFTQSGPPDRRSGDPVRLRWEVPIETRDITLPIEFKDLPMPRD